jgi:SAM-dependent methyltransferase
VRAGVTEKFYDQLAARYHLIYADWDRGIVNQAKALDGIIRSMRQPVRTVLDVACGIGTQALGLAKLGYSLEASDLSVASIRRARLEAKKRRLKIKFSSGDMTKLGRFHGGNFDLVIACDNAVPHLLTDGAILKAFREARKCLRPGASYLITVRDYDKEDKAAVQFRPYGVRKTREATYTLFQTWRFKGQKYDVALYTIEERPGKAIKTQVAKATYYAVGVGRLMALLKKAGFARVGRIDGAYFQPVIVATKN